MVLTILMATIKTLWFSREWNLYYEKLLRLMRFIESKGLLDQYVGKDLVKDETFTADRYKLKKISVWWDPETLFPFLNPRPFPSVFEILKRGFFLFLMISISLI